MNIHQLLWPLLLYAVVLAVWYRFHAEKKPALFYTLFAITVTTSVQLVGVYLVFATLIIPALAVRRLSKRSQSLLGGYLLGMVGFTSGLLLSAILDLPGGAVIVWTLAAFGLLVAFISKRAVSAAA